MGEHVRIRRAGALAALAVLGSASVLAGVAGSGDAWAAGCSAGTRSDINGDGWADAVVAAPGYRTGAGAIHVIYGSATGLHAAKPEAPLEDQLLTQDSPGVPGVRTSAAAFGSALATADFDGDGCTDVAVGSSGERGNRGAVTVLRGSPTGLTATGAKRYVPTYGGIPQVYGPALFGYSLAAGDYDGDGRADLAIGAVGDGLTSTGVTRGSVTVLRNGATGLGSGGITKLDARSLTVPGTANNQDWFGQALAAGDFDGNGVDDLAIGVPGEAKAAGAVVVLPGSSLLGLGVLPGREIDQDSPNVADEREAGDLFGGTLAAGDITGDGKDDLVVSAMWEDEGRGSVTLLKGNLLGLSGSGSQVWTKNSPGVAGAAGIQQFFGISLAIGSFDGTADANPDLAVGSQADVTGLERAGAVTYLRGAAEGLTTAGAGGSLLTQSAYTSKPDRAEAMWGTTLKSLPYGAGRDSLLVGSGFWSAKDETPRAGAFWELRGLTGGVLAGKGRTWTVDTPGVLGNSGQFQYFGAVIG